jgi:hypothetical protein
MEVHAHTHSPRKKWTHYFWEFLMLFLAVFAGFLAENEREYYVEHKREKVYARLLHDDLMKDTFYLNYVIKIKKWRGQKLDSLFYLMTLPDLQKNATRIYFYSSFLNHDIPFVTNDATIQQLRSSGTLRYFKNPGLYNAITQYYTSCAYYLSRENETKSFLPVQLRASLFDAEDFASLTTITPDIFDAFNYPAKEMKLLSTDKETVNKFLHYTDGVKKANDLSITLLQHFVADQLNQLLVALEKENYLK